MSPFPISLYTSGTGSAGSSDPNHIVHKFQTKWNEIRRSMVLERIFLPDIPTVSFFGIKRRKPRSKARRSENTVVLRILAGVLWIILLGVSVCAPSSQALPRGPRGGRPG